MAGAGSWQNLLPDSASKQLYASLYPAGDAIDRIDTKFHALIDNWTKGRIVRAVDGHILPVGPIMTDSDIETLGPWFQEIAGTMYGAVCDRLDTYRAQAAALAQDNGSSQKAYGSILTIQICAHTLDSWVFSRLRRDAMGSYTPRDYAGTFFFWGYAFADGAKRIFGFTTYGVQTGLRLHVFRSHGLDREILKSVLRNYKSIGLLNRIYCSGYLRDPDPSAPGPVSDDDRDQLALLRNIKLVHPTALTLSIPVFRGEAMSRAVELYQAVTDTIAARFMDLMPDLKRRIPECSFAQCRWSDICCMLFHLAYSYAADMLVENDIIPDFPARAGAEWGVWVH